MARNLDIRGRDVSAPLVAAGWDPASILYGVWQDFSAAKLGMVVRDSADREVGRITYHPLTREGWLTLETGAGSVEGDVVPGLRQTITLHPAADATQILCKFERMR